jgi:methylated-DNA-[protein]-cysteine S-methyltransferase
MTTLLLDRLPTPVGDLAIVADERHRLRAVGWFEGHARIEAMLGAATFVTTRDPGGLTRALRAYFEGELSAIDALPVHAEGTPFQRAVWGALREIPCGETWSYGQLARHIGKPGAARAVGLANHDNPVGVVVPCHRVIGANGALTGYGGGLERKRWLLAHERRRAQADLPFARSTAAVRYHHAT